MGSKLLQGDCLEVLKSIPDNSLDSIVTDPPYGLSFMGKRWDYDVPSVDVWAECLRVLKPGGHLLAFAGTRTQHRMAVRIEDAGFEIRDMIAWIYGSGFPKSHNLKDEWQGWGTALKPALEPITVARKPLIGTVAENVLAHGTGGLNIDACRVEGIKRDPGFKNPESKGIWSGASQMTEWADADKGRWPANLIHDGSDEVLAGFPANRPGMSGGGKGKRDASMFGVGGVSKPEHFRCDTGSAARFFYCAKASKKDRDEGNTHPTVKPTDLMRYLCRLVTPTGGVVLDPFMGSGSTGKAATIEGFDFIGIEMDEQYFNIAKARIEDAEEKLGLCA